MAAIEYLAEFQISKKEFDSLDPDLAAALGVVCYAFSEINTLMKLHLFSLHAIINNPPIDMMNAMQQQVTLRVWSAKIFEIADFLELKGKNNKTQNEMLLKLGCSAMKKFEKLNDPEIFPVVRTIRHEATNHYCLSPAKKNLPYLGENASTTIFLHEKDGNSFSPLGEEVMFIARMNRAASNEQSKEDKIAYFDRWQQWNVEAVSWIRTVHSEFVQKILIDSFPHRKLERSDHWIPHEMVGEVSEIKTPLFVRMNKYYEAKSEAGQNRLTNDRK